MKVRGFKAQYSHMYFARLMELSAPLKARVAKQWPQVNGMILFYSSLLMFAVKVHDYTTDSLCFRWGLLPYCCLMIPEV
jgi:maltodextrin utilization protein YvdJ